MQIVAAVVVLALLVTAGFFFLRGDGGGGGGGGGGKRSQPEVNVGDLELTVGGVFNANAGAPAQLTPEQQNAVMTTVGLYVEEGLLDPVREGETGENLPALFDSVTAPRLEGPDRAVILEEGLPELTGNFTPIAQPVIISTLSDAGGNFVLVTVTLNYSATWDTDAGPITSNRYHELTLIPSDDGVWRITGYDIAVIREGPGAQSTTTTAAA